MNSIRTFLFPSFFLCISICYHVANSQKNLHHTCSNDTDRLDFLPSLLFTLSSNANNPTGFYSSQAGNRDDRVVYGLFLCRGDILPSECQECVKNAINLVKDVCQFKNRANIFYEVCMLRYSRSNQSIFSKLDLDDPYIHSSAKDNDSDPTLLRDTLDAIATKAANGTDFPGKKFAVQNASLGVSDTIYALAQCTPDLSNMDCNTCLRIAFQLQGCCSNKVDGWVMYPSCNIRYSTSKFYEDPVIAQAGPGPHKQVIATGVVVAIALSIASCIVLFILGFVFGRRRSMKTHYSSKRLDESDKDDDITIDPESLQYSLRDIETATNDFSAENKIGQGGFGSVYKGILRNGEEIAVKRLSKSSGQGAAEFKNEIAVVAKLQHRNLVRLLGFCLEGREKILVYEFVPRRSLDYFLFDPEKQVLLNWARRRNIIGGIARGLVYLHEDSRLKIVHRDLKAGNILLDESMHPKIADFGMAKICVIDDSEGNTNRIAGTFGYMAPEYTRSGQYSTKSDVFSFGVVLLEIITGKKNSSFYQSEVSEDLISYAWRQWRDGTPLSLLDPKIGDSYVSAEVTQCVHISLLCVEEDANKRPTMASVVYMLNSNSVSLPIPHHPAVLRDDRLERPLRESNELLLESINEVSFTEPIPR